METHPETMEIEQLLTRVLEATRLSLQKEGADLEVEIEPRSKRVILSLVRERIVCEECLLPETMVQRTFRLALGASPKGSMYQIETRNWLL
jgi:hypothetical protein